MERAARERGATTAVSPDDGFRSFVAAVSEPLTRLAYVLTVGAPGQAAAGVLTANALAQVRRQWREVESAGLPEQLAVDALVAAVLKKRRGRASVDPIEAAVDAGHPPLVEASWRAFVGLPPRQRASLVFTDPTVVAVRLAGIDPPPALGSPRRQSAELAAAADALLAALRADSVINADPSTRADVDGLASEQVVRLAGDAVRTHASYAPSVFDPNTEVGVRVRELHRRAVLAGALVVVLLAVAGVSAVIASAPGKVTPHTAAPSASAVDSPSPPRTQPPQPPVAEVAAQPSADPDQSVVPWTLRGSLIDEPVLLARIEATFSQAHPDATTKPQVLLFTDTPAFRLAYVVARTPEGVLASWFSAPTGSPDLRESFAGYGRDLDSTSAVAARLHWAGGAVVAGAGPSSPRELVIIAPPTTPSIETFDPPDGTRAPQSIKLNDGIAVEVVRPGTLGLSPTPINVTTDTYAVSGIPDIELDPTKRYATGDAASEQLAAIPAVAVERGRPDPALLADALLVAQTWQPADAQAAATPVVLWAGTDAVGTKLVVARMHGLPYDLLILEWSGDAPRLHGEVLVRANSPEVPVAFAYRSTHGTRIGIISEPADKAVALTYEGHDSPTASFDADGFASIPLAGVGGLPSDVNVNASPPPSNNFVGLVNATVQVELVGFDDEVRTVLSVPPAL